MTNANEQRSGFDRRRQGSAGRRQQNSATHNHPIANISHELRTPMQAMLVSIDLLRETTLTSEQVQHVNVSRDACEYFLSLLDDLLDYSRLEQGLLQWRSDIFHLPQLVENVLQMMQLQARHKEIVFACHVDVSLFPWRYADSRRVRQILVNLLNNAIKFTEAGAITINVTALCAERVLLEVTDTGIGIPESQHQKIFDSFFRGHACHQQALPGVGLGLAICKQLANAMSGSITVKSCPGLGSTFGCELLLPLGHPRLLQDDENSADDNQLKTAGGEQFDLAVLVVEDSLLNCRVMEDLLYQLGCKPVCVHNGRDALKYFSSAQYDLVLMDMRMPVMDGLQATRSIRHLERFLSASSGKRHVVPVIALSASADPGEMKAALDAGCNDYLVKPLRKQALIRILRECVQDS